MDEQPEVRVYMRHIRGHFCSRGARTLAEHLGFDWSDFLRNGVPASDLIATGDAMAIQVAQIAIEERKHEQRQ